MAEPRKVTITLPDGRQVRAVEVGVESSNEKWSEYKLDDGTVFRCKVNLITVVRALDEFDLPTGNPVYQVNAQPALAFIDVPEHLKASKKAIRQ